MYFDLFEFFERFCCWLLFWGLDFLLNFNKFEMENFVLGWLEFIYVCSVVKDNFMVVICNLVSLIDLVVFLFYNE